MSRAAKVATGVAAAAVVEGLVVLAYPAFAALGGLEHPSASAVSTAEPKTAPDPSPSPCAHASSRNREAPPRPRS
ncbi:hypothetical protein [Microbacterium sp. NPDC056052]|uniref:hypothetical protein n=1 Tax=Microbacterium sp. NPDC056052 TaxID=3345695 RepID=UPI0035DCA1EB